MPHALSTTPARVTGSAVTWARDLGIVGASSGFFALYGVFGASVIAAALWAAAAGAAGGVVLGAVLPGLLDRLRGRVRLPLIAALLIPVGAVWGGVSGWAAGQTLTFTFGELGSLAPLTILVAAVAGAIQLGWMWFPYTFQTVRGGRTWPLVVAGCAITPALGWLATAVVSILAGVL